MRFMRLWNKQCQIIIKIAFQYEKPMGECARAHAHSNTVQMELLTVI